MKYSETKQLERLEELHNERMDEVSGHKWYTTCDLCEVGVAEVHYANDIDLCDECKMDGAVKENIEAYLDAMEGFYE